MNDQIIDPVPESNENPLRGNKGGFDIRDGHKMSLEDELRELAKNGYKIDETRKGIIIEKEV